MVSLSAINGDAVTGLRKSWVSRPQQQQAAGSSEGEAYVRVRTVVWPVRMRKRFACCLVFLSVKECLKTLALVASNILVWEYY